MSDPLKTKATRFASTSTGEPYPCLKPWPVDCMVQCGSRGVVISAKGNYRTAFFEAFPLSTFIRGQGTSIQEAEESAWIKYQAQLLCPEHTFQRKAESEHGVCTLCGHFRTHVFRPVHSCYFCSKPEVSLEFFGFYLCKDHYIEVARHPETFAAKFRSKQSSDSLDPLLTDAETFAGYRITAWDFDVLSEHKLIPESVEEHEYSRYLFDAHCGIRLDRARNMFLRSMYREWIEKNPEKPVGALMMLGIYDDLFSDEDFCKLVTVECLVRAKLIEVNLSATDWSLIRGVLETRFDKCAAEFHARR